VGHKMEKEIRPWGSFLILCDEPDHKIKRIIVSPGKRLSLQSHHRRTEHWYVIKGNALVTLDDRKIMIPEGHSIDIPRSSRHRIENTGSMDVVLIEVQTGTYFGEDDIIRYEDDYGRI
ncbi:MAG: phosphomannose isomerase type II C-terminal cupin domain, partial [Syntrophales bacterium]|nr:phosphomannose isomerase type II C-terminal cupin domain [Syntrophales bacterium]